MGVRCVGGPWLCLVVILVKAKKAGSRISGLPLLCMNAILPPALYKIKLLQ